jgi:hypothetical protein
MDLAAAGEARRRREQPYAARPARAGGFARSLFALAAVLIVFGLVLAQALRAGLF